MSSQFSSDDLLSGPCWSPSSGF